MKKTLFTAISALTLAGLTAQSNFFTKTCYRGAFAPAPAAMWTEGWTEWDPQNKSYPPPTMTVTGDISSNTTWSSGSVVLLSSQCFIKNNSILTIQPGVTVLGDKASNGACLVVTKGSQLIANGTAQSPIVFTSNQAPGNRSLGDWGGIILLGKAPNNYSGGTANIEGFPVSSDTEHGVSSGSDANDNSGSLKYVRIEFGGYVYQPNQEINGLTMGSVGRGTAVDHVQVSFVNDDGFEWFGGTVNAKYLVSFRNLDDDFDTDNGYSGLVQFCLAVRDPQLADAPSVSTSEIFESDNNASGSQVSPFTSAIFSNVTAIGPLRGNPGSTIASGHQRGLRIRRASKLRVINSIFMDNATRGIFIDGSAAEGHANSGELVFANNILAGYGVVAIQSGTVISPSPSGWLMSPSRGNDTLKSATGILSTPYNYTTPDYRPSSSSPALTGASFTHSVLTGSVDNTPLQVQATIPASFCVGNNTANITPAVTAAASTVSAGYCALNWIVPAGVAVSNSTATNPSFTISTLGSFTIQLIVTNAEGTSTVSNVVNTYTCLDVGVGENTGYATGRVYPNPCADKTVLEISLAGLSKEELTLYDITGRPVQAGVQAVESVGGTQFTIDTSELPDGVYFARVGSGELNRTFRLIVARS